MELFMVGGAVRDEILGVRSKDIDFTVVLTDKNIQGHKTKRGNERTPFEVMEFELVRRGFKIFLRTPEHFTIRAQFPRMGNPVLVGRENRNLTADFVLARIEGPYSDGRRPDWVKPGRLEDDLARRDFTMNAIAKAADGSLIDPFNGQEDISKRIIRAVGDPVERLEEDALRALRAVRFAVTKDFAIDGNLAFAMQDGVVLDSIRNKISDERIQQELSKMFRFDTPKSLRLMVRSFPHLTEAVFSGGVSLDATMKQKGRGK